MLQFNRTVSRQDGTPLTKYKYEGYPKSGILTVDSFRETVLSISPQHQLRYFSTSL